MLSTKFARHAHDTGIDMSLKTCNGLRADLRCRAVDPLDGTTNFFHAYPSFATSVGGAAPSAVHTRAAHLVSSCICHPAHLF